MICTARRLDIARHFVKMHPLQRATLYDAQPDFQTKTSFPGVTGVARNVGRTQSFWALL
jgi:hypothetical protein